MQVMSKDLQVERIAMVNLFCVYHGHQSIGETHWQKQKRSFGAWTALSVVQSVLDKTMLFQMRKWWNFQRTFKHYHLWKEEWIGVTSPICVGYSYCALLMYSHNPVSLTQINQLIHLFQDCCRFSAKYTVEDIIDKEETREEFIDVLNIN